MGVDMWRMLAIAGVAWYFLHASAQQDDGIPAQPMAGTATMIPGFSVPSGYAGTVNAIQNQAAAIAPQITEALQSLKSGSSFIQPGINGFGRQTGITTPNSVLSTPSLSGLKKMIDLPNGGCESGPDESGNLHYCY